MDRLGAIGPYKRLAAAVLIQAYRDRQFRWLVGIDASLWWAMVGLPIPTAKTIDRITKRKG